MMVAGGLHYRQSTNPANVELGPAIYNMRHDMVATELRWDGWQPRSELQLESYPFPSRYENLAPFSELFAELGPYPDGVHLSFLGGGVAGYATRLKHTGRFGYSDARIGKGGPEDVLFDIWRTMENGSYFPGHYVFARPALLERIGVNLIPAGAQFLQPPYFSRPPDLTVLDHPNPGRGLRYRSLPPQQAWAVFIMYSAVFGTLPARLPDGRPLTAEYIPPDSQLFALPLVNGNYLPVLYFNRNGTIDRILAANDITPVAVF